MKILLILPNQQTTFISYDYIKRFGARIGQQPPMGLLTVAAMLPKEWEKKFVDMNIVPLTDEDIKWSDYCFISAMCIHRGAVKNLLTRCRKLGAKTVAGGPLFTAECEDFPEADHLVLNEAEITLPQFLQDIENGRPKHIYKTDLFADLRVTPEPLWELVNLRRYGTVGIQYSRGCPYECEFCSAVSLFGHRQRTKGRQQFISELDKLYNIGWRGAIEFADDNIICDKNKFKKELLPALIDWMKSKEYPFLFHAQIPLNFSDDDELLKLMPEAGFFSLCIGFESINKDSLIECNKRHNLSYDIVNSAKKIHGAGLIIHASFILGFDSDTPEVFKNLIPIIQKSAFVLIGISLLTAMRGTKLYQRMKKENRLIKESLGAIVECSTNFIPKMDREVLIKCYRDVVETAYDINNYYERLVTFLKDFNFKGRAKMPLGFRHAILWLNSIFFLGIIEKERFQYWKMTFWCLTNKPKLYPMAIRYALNGYHFRRYYRRLLYGK